MNKVTIRGCFSVSGKKGWKIIKNWDTTKISVQKIGEELVMRGTERLEIPVIQVGNLIEIQLERNSYDKDNSFWMERTNVPYVAVETVNTWTNIIHAGSDVFREIPESSEEAVKISILDPPTATLKKSRKLEFIIFLRGEETEKNFLMLAEQNIVPIDADEGKFQTTFVVYKCGFVRKPSEEEQGEEEENWYDELLSKLGGYATGYGEQQSEMEDIRECFEEIPQGNFEGIPVELSASELCEFNSWDEEP